MCCWLPYKGKKISANHNLEQSISTAYFVVDYLTKVRKFQLITTNESMPVAWMCCWLPYKGKKISANHNCNAYKPGVKQVVDYLTKVRKFQLITTATVALIWAARCWLPYKGKKISANHNQRHKVFKTHRVVDYLTKVRKFQLITTCWSFGNNARELLITLQR